MLIDFYNLLWLLYDFDEGVRISNKNLVTNILVSVAVAIISFALLNTLNQSPQNWDPAAFLLGVCGLAASISGIGFALYGYYNTNRAEKIVEEKLKVKFNEYEKIMNERNLRMQEALQKMLSGYSVHHIEKDPDRAIELYKSAVELYPEIYNGYNALAYAYWYDKKDFMKAKEYLM